MNLPLNKVVEASEKIYYIPLHFIKPLPLNTSEMDSATFQRLASDMGPIMSRGLERVEPILVRPMTTEEIEEARKANPEWMDVKYEIVDGHRRYEAAKYVCGWTHIRAKILNITREEALEQNYRKNRERGQVNQVLEGLFFRHLMEERNLTARRIAEMFGLTEANVEAIAAKAKVTREARRILMKSGRKITPRAIEVIRSAPEHLQAKLAMGYMKGLSPSHLERLRNLLDEGLSFDEALKEAVKKPAEERVVEAKITRAPRLEKPRIKEMPKKPAAGEAEPTAAPRDEAAIVEAHPPAQRLRCPTCGRLLEIRWGEKAVRWL